MNEEATQKPQQEMKEVVRILNTDINGDSNTYYGLTKITGISWNLSNAICYILKLDKTTKVGTLPNETIKKIEETIKNLGSQNLPAFILNRPRTSSGKANHLTGSDLELQKRMDIKRLRDIQSYKGIRHALNLPVRGQRTKSNFRKGRAVGVIKKKPQKSKPKTTKK